MVDPAVLVEQARAGDMTAFSRLVTLYQDRVLNVCWRLCGSLEDAQDLTQEAFLHALQSVRSFRQRAQFYTWLFRIAVNLCISHRRKAARAPKLSLHGPDGEWIGDDCGSPLARTADADDPAMIVAGRELQERVLEELDKLDEDYRAVLVLRELEEMDYQQIADVLQVAVGTVKSRLHRGRMELRERLRRCGV